MVTIESSIECCTSSFSFIWKNKIKWKIKLNGLQRPRAHVSHIKWDSSSLALFSFHFHLRLRYTDDVFFIIPGGGRGKFFWFTLPCSFHFIDVLYEICPFYSALFALDYSTRDSLSSCHFGCKNGCRWEIESIEWITAAHKTDITVKISLSLSHFNSYCCCSTFFFNSTIFMRIFSHWIAY